MKKKILLSDNEKENVNDDEFGFGSYVDILEKSIDAVESLPFTVGIFGEWGSGKTTLMKFLKNRFDEKDCKTIWINPWKYDKKEELWSALIRGILIEIEKEDSGLKKQIGELLAEMAFIAVKGGISYLSGGLLTGSLENFRKDLAEVKKSEQEFLHNFDEKFKKVVEDFVINSENKKLIIFIDDLDRCQPENAITVLEAIKLYLDNEYCIFILGIDRAIIEMGIKCIYGDKIDISGREYLDKIIQLPFFIPTIQFEKLNKSLSSSSIANYSDDVWLLINHGFGGNPRKAKRFVNAYYLLKEALKTRTIKEKFSAVGSEKEFKIFNEYSKEKKDFYLAKILIIQMLYPEFYDYLRHNHNALTEVEQGFSFFKRPEALGDYLKKYPALKPFFEDKYNNFIRFMRETKSNTENYPEIPSRHVLKYLLLVANLVEGEKKTNLNKNNKTRKSSGTAKYDFSSSRATDSSASYSTDYNNKI